MPKPMPIILPAQAMVQRHPAFHRGCRLARARPQRSDPNHRRSKRPGVRVLDRCAAYRPGRCQTQGVQRRSQHRAGRREHIGLRFRNGL
jgi:hypothetical protein